jgi:hypothetical protein
MEFVLAYIDVRTFSRLELRRRGWGPPPFITPRGDPGQEWDLAGVFV